MNLWNFEHAMVDWVSLCEWGQESEHLEYML